MAQAKNTQDVNSVRRIMGGLLVVIGVVLGIMRSMSDQADMFSILLSAIFIGLGVYFLYLPTKKDQKSIAAANQNMTRFAVIFVMGLVCTLLIMFVTKLLVTH